MSLFSTLSLDCVSSHKQKQGRKWYVSHLPRTMRNQTNAQFISAFHTHTSFLLRLLPRFFRLSTYGNSRLRCLPRVEFIVASHSTVSAQHCFARYMCLESVSRLRRYIFYYSKRTTRKIRIFRAAADVYSYTTLQKCVNKYQCDRRQ